MKEGRGTEGRRLLEKLVKKGGEGRGVKNPRKYGKQATESLLARTHKDPKVRFPLYNT